MPDINPFQQAAMDYVTGAKMAVASGLEQSPEEAARTVQLESATGVPSSVIQADPENFEKMAQRQAATRLVSQNPQLMAYVHSHPMAASVSGDDWGKLDQYSRSAGMTSSILGILNGPFNQALDTAGERAVSGFKEGFGTVEPFKPSPYAAVNLVKSADLLSRVVQQGMSGVFQGLTQGVGGAVEGAAKSFGASPSTATSLGREASALTEYHMISPGGDFVAAHEEPPKGIHPAVDALKAQLNARAVEALDADMKAAQQSATLERSPEMFQRLAEQHYGNITIGLHNFAVDALYKNKTPNPDDGLLGWVPGIADKLEQARLTNADVQVPLAGWVSRIDPMVAEQLHNDIRMWPGGITAREAGEAEPPKTVDEMGNTVVSGEPEVQGIPFQYHDIVDSPLAQVRGAYGLEPMFSMGDRKLTLDLDTKDTMPAQAIDGSILDKEIHLYNILDENKRPVGVLHIMPDGKQLIVDNIEGVAGQWANSFGPSLMRDLLKQIKTIYPDAETLTGYRVSGARSEAGHSGFTTVRLDAPEGWDKIEGTRRVFADAYRPVPGSLAEANIQPSSAFLAHEKEIAAAVHDELTKITGGKARVIPTAGISYKGYQPRGLFFPRASLIMYDLLGDDPLATGRHEVIHFLRDQGLFTDKEWSTLKEAAMQEGWLDRYNINSRYEGVYQGRDLEERKYEESIAEAFREWAGAKDEARRQYSPVARIFQKMMDFLNGLKSRFAEIFGHVPSADELFSKVSSGEIGQRASMGEPRSTNPLFSIEELDNLKAEGLGLDLKSFQRLQKLVQERHRADVEASLKQAEKEQTRRQTTEWKEAKAALEPEVEQTIRQRPDVAADLFIGSGELYGDKIQQRFTLRGDDLSPEQKAALPQHYVSKNGLPVDEVARLFGYQTGGAMVQHLAALHAFKDGRSPKEFMKDLVEQETERQMEAKYGNLAENILSEAKNQALSENDLNLLTEEYHAAALQAGVTGVDKDTILAKAKDIVDKTPLNEVNFDKQMLLIGRNYRDAVRALVGGKPADAVVSLEKRTLAAHVASEMKKVVAEKAKFDNIAKKYAKKWDPAKNAMVQPDFSLYIRDILSKVGLRNGMSGPMLAKSVAEGEYKGLAEFVTKTEAVGRVAGIELAVPDWMFQLQPNGRPLETMPVAQFREVRDAVTQLDKLGRAEQRIIRAGEAQDRAEWIAKARSQLANKFDPLPSTRQPGILDYGAAAFTSNETLMSRWDGRDNHGIFTETFTKPGAQAANIKAAMQREVARKLKALGPIVDPLKKLESPFIDPFTGKPRDFDRRNLAALISNMGNNYNWSIMAKGWKVDPDALMKWVEQNSTAEDIERAQNLGKIFSELKGQSDNVERHLFGIASEDVVPRPFTMHGRQWDGWYHPIIGDPILSRYVNKMPSMEAETNFWPTTNNNFLKRRTGAVQVLDLSYDALNARIDQVVHSIALREFVANSARVLKDESFRTAVRQYYGKEYLGSMDRWLQRVAGESSYSNAALSSAEKWSNILRQNVVTTAIGFGLSTIEKHVVTAFAMSGRELGPNLFKTVPELLGATAQVARGDFKKANAELYAMSPHLGDSIWDFVHAASEEIQRRDRNYLDTLGGQHLVQVGTGRPTVDTLNLTRQKLTELGAKGVSFSDKISAVPLWWAKYSREMIQNGGDFGAAVAEADLAVRRAHGSTATTNLPEIAASRSVITPWMTSLYGFMGTSMQRRIELAHDVNDMFKLRKREGIIAAAKQLPPILSSAAVYVIWTGLVEEYVSSQFTDDRRGFGAKAFGFLFGSVANSFIGLRDLAYDLKGGSENVGLIGTPIHHMQHLLRDVDKQDPVGRAHAGQLIEDMCSIVGDLAGLCPTPLGRAAHYGLDYFSSFQQPRDATDVYRGLVHGKQKLTVVR